MWLSWALVSKSKGLGFDSQCWSCVEVSDKLRIPHFLGPPSCNGYMVHRSKVGSIVAGCIGANLTRGKVKSVEHALSWSLDSKELPLPLPFFAIHNGCTSLSFLLLYLPGDLFLSTAEYEPQREGVGWGEGDYVMCCSHMVATNLRNGAHINSNIHS